MNNSLREAGYWYPPSEAFMKELTTRFVGDKQPTEVYDDVHLTPPASQPTAASALKQAPRSFVVPPPSKAKSVSLSLQERILLFVLLLLLLAVGLYWTIELMALL